MYLLTNSFSGHHKMTIYSRISSANSKSTAKSIYKLITRLFRANQRTINTAVVIYA